MKLRNQSVANELCCSRAGGFGSCLKIAPTGSAAHNIGGYTWQSALGKTTKNSIPIGQALDQKKAQSLQRKLAGVKLVIFDEVSMLGAEDLVEIDKRLRAAAASSEPFGGCHILFTGDFYQLPPVKKTKLYNTATVSASNRRAFAGGALWRKVTSYYELSDNKRHGDSPDPHSLPAFLKGTRVRCANRHTCTYTSLSVSLLKGKQRRTL